MPDHVIPLSQGGTDDDDNIQCLCEACHALKTAAEGFVNQGAANHPHWLEKSCIPLTIISGPPCAGKTTYVRAYAAASDTIIDLDTILTRLRPNYKHWSGLLDPDLLDQSIRVRNAMLGKLARTTTGRAWFIVSAPTKDERAWWVSKLGGQVVLLHPGLDECHRRAVARGTPQAIKGADAWEFASKQPWFGPSKPKPKKATIGTDGWPIE